ncbi:GDSL-type esterase/lipase family protein [uncultured Dokdonia sp.]|uniref:GDSL-type esterase/lipase family protein n=1 Tax=uncultured Dokdonia sp. TaxID=575653 RepID=UPI00261D1542|nr:GDSL-type esterase/lipase family protein [uncultured Dokdonia sp.]
MNTWFQRKVTPLQSLNYFLLLIAIFTVVGCTNSDDELPERIQSFQILSIGDSRVEGHETDFVSYRYELWKLLKNDNSVVDFFGSRIDQRVYPDFQETQFDTQHEGKSGDRIDEALVRLDTLLTNNPSVVGNIVLLGIGGNDLIQGISAGTAIQNLNHMIDKLQATNSTTTIFIEKIAPGTSSFQESNAMNQSEYDAFNEAISNLAIIRTTSQSRVIAVDMSTILTDEDYADEVHYNQSGAQKVASQYYEAIQSSF